MKIEILPSLLSADFGHLADGARLAERAGGDALHLDIMDGHFVPNLTFGPDTVAAVRRAVRMPLNVHLMLTHPERFVKRFVDAGADYINIADSAGHMVPDDVRKRISALKDSISITVGFHSHNNLGCAVANSLAAVEEGATYIDATCRGLGAGAGNTQSEVFCAVLDRLGYDTGVDIYALMDVAEKTVEPIMPRPQVITTSPLMLGYAGVYSSFLLHTYRAAEKFNLNPREILVELGRRQMVGGQEDMIVDVAYALSQQKQARS